MNQYAVAFPEATLLTISELSVERNTFDIPALRASIKK
jgi:hypothetical protein